jgi:release factor glutamine methyltransferase
VTGSTTTWRELLRDAEAQLAAAGRESAEVDARRIVEEVSGYEGAELVLVLREPASSRAVARLDALVERRSAGEPLQYVLGRWSFRTLDLLVDRRVLIPRPETEVVAGAAIDELTRRRAATGSGAPRLRAVDLGTGSGAIALSIAAECDGVDVWATDRSPDAVAVARANLAGLGRRGTAVAVVEGSWFDALPPDLAGTVDLIVSNPPYVGEAEVLPSEVADWEPGGALVAGPRGLEDLELIVDASTRWLVATGALVLELAPHQASAIAARARAAGFAEVEVLADLAGRDRAVVARRGGT